MDYEFESIIPWNGEHDTGRDARQKLDRNFAKIKANFEELAGDTKYVTTTFFSRLFGIDGEDGAEVDVNDMEAVIKAVRVKFGFYTNSYISALGLNPEAGSTPGGSTTLAGLTDVSITGTPGDGQVLAFDVAAGKWKPADAVAGLDEEELAQYLTTNNYAKKTDITAALEGYALKTTRVIAGAGLTGGGTLAADRTLALATVGTAGTYVKVTVDQYGRVTGHGSLAAGDIPTLSISKISGLQSELNSKLDANVFEELFEKVYVSGYGYAIRAKLALYSEGWMSAKGQNPDAGAGSGGSTTLAGLTDVSITGTPGDGQVLAFDSAAGKWKPADATAGLDEEELAQYLTAHGYATQSWVNQQGFLKSSSLDGYVKKSGDTMTGALTTPQVKFNNTYDTRIGTGYSSSYGDYMELNVNGASGVDATLRIGNVGGHFTFNNQNVLHEGNYTDYTVTKTGGGASGTWAIGISGNAATASKLQTARTLWGQSFDGSSNVDGSMTVTGSVTVDYGYVYVSSGWFQNNSTGRGLYNGAHDARWYANPSGWVADKVINSNLGFQTGGYVHIGSAVLRYDSSNNALYVEKSDGTACGFYATGFLSAKGANDDGGDTEATVLTIADERDAAIYPDTYAGRGIRGLFRANATDGLDDGGTYHTVLHIRQWANSGGGLSHQLAFTDNGGVWHRTAQSETAWGEWSELSALSGLSDVSLSSPSNGQALVYRDGYWRNETVSGGGGSASVAWSDITGKPSWIGSSKPSYSFSEITGTPSLTISSSSSANLTVNVEGASKTISSLYATYSTYANYLRTSRTIWGQSFNGGSNISGNMTGVGSITASGVIKGTQMFSTHNDMLIFGPYSNNRVLSFGWSSANGDYMTYWIPGAGNHDDIRMELVQNIRGLMVYDNIRYSGTCSASSDMRLKKKLGDLDLTVEQVADAPSFRFKWRNRNETAIGSSAQYWADILPDAICKDPKGYLMMPYGNIALAAVITTARTVVDHEARIKELEKENMELKERLSVMERRVA